MKLEFFLNKINLLSFSLYFKGMVKVITYLFVLWICWLHFPSKNDRIFSKYKFIFSKQLLFSASFPFWHRWRLQGHPVRPGVAERVGWAPQRHPRPIRAAGSFHRPGGPVPTWSAATSPEDHPGGAAAEGSFRPNASTSWSRSSSQRPTGRNPCGLCAVLFSNRWRRLPNVKALLSFVDDWRVVFYN